MQRILRVGLLALLLVSSALDVSLSQSKPPAVGTATEEFARVTASQKAPAWITDPASFPQGRRGKNICTFAFGQVVDFSAHPDEAGCWEHKGPEGWVRQQISRVHVAKFSVCSGAAGDIEAIRVCHPDAVGGGAKQMVAPCEGKKTGPNGCATCVANPTCH